MDTGGLSTGYLKGTRTAPNKLLRNPLVAATSGLKLGIVNDEAE